MCEENRFTIYGYSSIADTCRDRCSSKSPCCTFVHLRKEIGLLDLSFAQRPGSTRTTRAAMKQTLRTAPRRTPSLLTSLGSAGPRVAATVRPLCARVFVSGRHWYCTSRSCPRTRPSGGGVRAAQTHCSGDGGWRGGDRWTGRARYGEARRRRFRCSG